MNIIWLILITVSIVAAVFTGRLEALTQALFDGAKTAVEISLFLLGIVSLWLGITKIIEDSGLIHRISHLLSRRLPVFLKPFLPIILRSPQSRLICWQTFLALAMPQHRWASKPCRIFSP